MAFAGPRSRRADSPRPANAAGTSTSFSYIATPEKYRVASSSVHERSVAHSAGVPPGPMVTRQPEEMSMGAGIVPPACV